MKKVFFSCGVLLIAAGCTAETSPEELAGKNEPFYYNTNRVWSTSTIPVCWETSNYATERAWVQSAIEYQIEALTNINFTGWGVCGSGGAEIVIEFETDVWPVAPVTPRAPSPNPNVHLNPFVGPPQDTRDDDPGIDFPNCWSQSPGGSAPYTDVSGLSWPTRQEWCVKSTAVHEMMHAVGVVHEQYRGDTPPGCGTGVGNKTAYGYWDLLAASNYCNPLWSGGTLISTLDVSALAMLYGSAVNDHLWWGLGDAQPYISFTNNQIMFDVHHHNNIDLQTPVIGDFDSDGNDDILWYGIGSTPDAIEWGSSNRNLVSGSITVTGSYKPIVGDFDGDGNSDIFWYKAGIGTDWIWWGNDNRTFTSSNTALQVDGFFEPQAGDFDGDGKTDIYLYGVGTLVDDMRWGRADRTFDSGNVMTINGTYEPMVGNFDGDCCDDIFFYRPGTGSDPMRWGRTDRGFDSGNSPTVNGTYDVAVGDFDGNGMSDIVWSRNTESDGLWLFQPPVRGSYISTDISSTISDAKPYAGNFDGDNFSDLIWYQPG